MRKIILSFMLCLLLCGLVSAQDSPMPYEIALQRIEEARLNEAIELNLSGLGLEEVPPEIGGLSKLQWLLLYDNQLTQLPPQIGKLSELYYLILANNLLDNLPPEIENLTKLCHIDISNNQFEQLPLALSQLDLLDEIVTNCSQRNLDTGIYVEGNPLISPPPEVVDQGTAAILDYLRNEAWWHLQRLILGGIGSIGVIVASILGLRWRKNRGKTKQKNQEPITKDE